VLAALLVLEVAGGGCCLNLPPLLLSRLSVSEIKLLCSLVYFKYFRDNAHFFRDKKA